nr:MAG TPA: hypothetical protein [Caudoviricetes sp.]
MTIEWFHDLKMKSLKIKIGRYLYNHYIIKMVLLLGTFLLMKK